MIDGDAIMQHYPLLVNYARKRLPDADLTICEDIAADAVERALTKYRELGHPDGLRRWLVTVARNAVIDYRRCRAGRELPLLHVDIAHGRLDAGSAVHAEWLDLRAGLAKLAPHHADRLRQFNDGYGHQELAQAAGRAHTTFKTTHHRAVLALRKAMHAEVAS
jgi:RNA polymerase sigma factor (sigma-70 family)